MRRNDISDSVRLVGRAIDEYLAVLDDAAFGVFAYSTNYLIDIGNAIIVDVEATTAIRQAEVLAAKRMIERWLERFDLYPSRLLRDRGYGSAEMLAWLVYEHGIEPHVTVFDKSARTDGIFSRDDFTMTMLKTSIVALAAKFSPRPNGDE
ncbi:hypothetical protein GGD64_005479 [Bradyrhizobium sp. CIR3A]|nr:hypothetical protein [Bradyrhizobium sp. CIR3A]NYG47679.1 hypothetical protein [Bradyrhizobium sp. IAR9]